MEGTEGFFFKREHPNLSTEEVVWHNFQQFFSSPSLKLNQTVIRGLVWYLDTVLNFLGTIAVRSSNFYGIRQIWTVCTPSQHQLLQKSLNGWICKWGGRGSDSLREER